MINKLKWQCYTINSQVSSKRVEEIMIMSATTMENPNRIQNVEYIMGKILKKYYQKIWCKLLECMW